MNNVIGVFKLSDEAILPTKGTEMSACYDIRACLYKDTVKVHGRIAPLKVEDFGTPEAYIKLYSGEMVLVPTGLVFCIPSEYHLKFYSRSGNIWKRFLVVANQPAVIDADYTNESFVLVHNKSSRPQTIVTGDAIAQCEMCDNVTSNFINVNDAEFDDFRKSIVDNSSREGGFGSTGR